MKKNMFLAVALATIVAIPSCTRENSNTPEGNGQETYASFTITLPEGSATRAPSSTTGTAAEKAVKVIGIYIIDEKDGTLHFEKKDVNSSNFTSDGSEYTSKFTVKTTTGMKTVVVLVNPTDAVHNRLLNIRKNALGSNGFGLPSTDFKTLVPTLESLVMTGAKKNVDLTTVRSETDAKDAPEEINISRNLAKVVVTKASTWEVIGGTLDQIYYTLVAEAKDAHLTEQATPLFYITPTEIADPGEYTGTYFANFTSLVAGSSATYVVVPENPTNAEASVDGFYTFENGADIPYGGNTTAVRLKGRFTPTTVVATYDPTDDTKTTAAGVTGASFYLRYNGEYWTTTAHDAAISNDEDDFYLAPAQFSGQYVNGVGYYTLPVQDDQGVEAVKRNYYYLLQVERVLGPGAPTEEEIDDPEKPVEKDTYLAVKATVLPWNLQSSVHEIQ
jgi:hypothetical protein